MKKWVVAAALGCAAVSACGDAAESAITLPDGGVRDAGPDAASAPDASPAVDASFVIDSGGAGTIDDCSGAAKLVYVVDSAGMLSSFQPDTLKFEDIGVLKCEASGSPFSMSVDRTGTAWVVYESGQLYRVSTSDASCTPIARTIGDSGFTKFGMGFVAIDGMPDQDKLFIAGDKPLDLSFDFTTSLGVIDPSTLATTRVGPLSGAQPELTGTGDGKLWAFYAQDMPPSVARLDPATATSLESHALANVGGGGASAWAFAFWGGDFWLFLQGLNATSSTVYRVKGDTFEQTAVIPDTRRTIVGAGVSTCAPLILR